MDVSIILINYNTYQYTSDAIESIMKYTDKLSYEIILIDNDSNDGSGFLLASKFKGKILYIQSDVNLGTSRAFNQGVGIAEGKYILWLNTDVLLKDNFVYKLYKYMEQSPECGICGGNLFNMNNSPMHSYRRKLPSLKTVKKDYSIFYALIRKIFKKHLSLEFNYTKNPLEVGYITGADMMIRKELLIDLNGFDEDIFMYAEESEFTFRVKSNTTFKVMSVPSAEMYHLEGGSFGKNKDFNPKRFNLMLNGNFIYFRKCYGNEAAIKYLKILRNSSKKVAIISKMLFLRNKSIRYKNEYKSICAFMEQIKEEQY